MSFLILSTLRNYYEKTHKLSGQQIIENRAPQKIKNSKFRNLSTYLKLGTENYKKKWTP